ncbi:MAG: cyclic nucleotide-binding domain-containing protein [Thermodesulfobacteriota bacterium]|nr:cyclic nucleotide-binding domain-containing protein [Thermodesulfobacteriota bacterium]
MAGEVVFAGDLSFIGLADILQMLGSNRSTGVVRITTKGVSGPGLIYFQDGNPINATNGQLQGIEAIYPLFGWAEGKFVFHRQKVQVEHVIRSSRMEIILDGMKMLDEGLLETVGPKSITTGSGTENGQHAPKRQTGLPIIKGPLVDYMYVIDEEQFRDGEQIVTEGGHGNWIWVILEGSVTITRQTANGPMTLARLGEGCFVGALASFLLRGHVRSATVTAAGDVQLGVLDARRLSGEYATLSSDFRGLLLSLDGRLRKITDRAVELYAKKHKNNGLAKNKRLVMKEDSPKKSVYTITGGEAYVMRRTAKGYLPLLTLREGDVFGNVPFVDLGHEPRRARVLASDDLKVDKVDGELITREYDGLSATLRNLVDSMATCVSLTTTVACHLKEGKRLG